MSLTLRAPILDETIKVARWREDCLQALRTPYRLSQDDQERFHAQSPAMRHERRLWSFHDLSLKDSFVAFGGIQGIQWENGLAEISLVVSPSMNGKGYGLESADLIATQAFDHLRLQQVWGECYECGPIGFWRKWVGEHNGYTTTLPRRKYWNGTFYDAMYFAVFKP